MRPSGITDGILDKEKTGLRGFVWMRRPEVAGSGAARLRWSHA